MNLKRFIKMRELKSELKNINGEIIDNVLMQGLINVITFLMILCSISSILIFELSFLPILCLLGLNIGGVFALNKARDNVNKEIEELHKQRDEARINIYNYKYGITKNKKALSDNDIKSLINVQDINRVYNVLKEEKKEQEGKKLESVNQYHENKTQKANTVLTMRTSKVKITADMIDKIYQVFEDSNNITDKSQDEINGLVLTQINDIFDENTEYMTAHKINYIDHSFIKKIGTR